VLCHLSPVTVLGRCGLAAVASQRGLLKVAVSLRGILNRNSPEHKGVCVADAYPRGRPRDPRIDDVVLAATLELLAERGFTETTVQAVARRARVGASAIYRRWPSRIELIESAIFPGLDALVVTPTGDVHADLRGFVTAYCEMFDSPAARAAIPGLFAAYQSQPERHQALAQRVGPGVRDAFRTMLASAAAGTVDQGIDPDAVLDVLIGAALYRSFIRPFTGRDSRDDYITDLLLRALRPAGLHAAVRQPAPPR
jgi:AcrR family transcriptional regulator